MRDTKWGFQWRAGYGAVWSTYVYVWVKVVTLEDVTGLINMFVMPRFVRPDQIPSSMLTNPLSYTNQQSAFGGRSWTIIVIKMTETRRPSLVPGPH